MALQNPWKNEDIDDHDTLLNPVICTPLNSLRLWSSDIPEAPMLTGSLATQATIICASLLLFIQNVCVFCVCS